MGCYEDIDGYFSLRGGEFDDAGASATTLKSALLACGAPQEAARRAAVAAFEAEMNVIIHAVAGTLQYRVEDGSVVITVTDMGPGIPDVEKAMQEGYSTAPDWARQRGWGSGLGLPNIRKNTDAMDISTTLGEGTTIRMTIGLGGKPAGGAEGA